MDEEGANQTIESRDFPREVIGYFAPTHVSEQMMFPRATSKFGTLSANDSYIHCLVLHVR